MKKSTLFVLQISLLVGFLTALFVLSPPVFRRIDEAFSELREETISELETLIGKNISFNSVSPSIFQFLEIRNLFIYDSSPGDFINVRNIKVYYDLFSLMSGERSKMIKEIRFENTEFMVDLDRDRTLIQETLDFIDSFEQGDLPPWNFSGQNLTLSVNSEDFSIKLSDLDFEWVSRSQGFDFQLLGELSGTSTQAPVSNFRTNLRTSGRLSSSLDDAVLTVEIERTRSNLGSIERLAFQMNIQDELYSFSKIQDTQPWNLNLVYNQATSTITSRIEGDSFTPGSFTRLSGELASQNSFLNTTFTGVASLEWNLETGRGTYNFDGQFSIPQNLFGFAMDIQAKGEGTQESVSFDNLSLTSLNGGLGFSGNLRFRDLFPRGLLRFSNFQLPEMPRIDGLVRIDRINDNRLRAISDSLSLGEMDIASFQGNYQIVDSIPRVGINFAIPFEENNGSIDVNLSFPNGLEQYEVFSGEVYIDRLVVSALQKALPTGLRNDFDMSFLGSTRLSSSVEIISDGNELEIQGYRLLIDDPNNPGYRLETEFDFSSSGLRLSPLEISIGDQSWLGFSHSTWDERGNITVNNQLRTGNNSYAMDVFYLSEDRSVTISGDYGIQGELNIDQEDRLNFKLLTNNLPLPLSEGRLSLSLDLEGSFSSLDDFILESRTTKVRFLDQASSQDWSLDLIGRLTPLVLDLPTLKLQINETLFSGDWVAYRNNADSFEFRTEAFLSSEEGESIQWQGTLDPRRSDFTLDIRAFDFGRFRTDFDGILESKITLRGPLLSPDVSVEGALNQGSFQGDSFGLDFNLRVQDQKLQVNRVSVQYVQSQLQGVTGLIDLNNFSSQLTGILQTRVGTQNFRTLVDLELNSLANSLDLGNPSASLDSLRGQILFSEMLLGNNSIPEQVIRFYRFQNIFSFQGGEENSITGSLTDTGRFDFSLTDPSPLRFDASGTYSEGILEADIFNVSGNLSDLDDIISIPGFDIISGTMVGNLTATGRIGDPGIQGTLNIEDFGLVTELIDFPITDQTISLEFLDRYIQVQENDLKIGINSTDLTGRFNFDHWALADWNIDIAMTEGTYIPVNTSIAGLSYQGDISGQLGVKGSNLDLQVQGDLDIQNMQLSLVETEEDSELPYFNLFVDISVTTGRQVQFLWPNNTFPVIQAFADTSQVIRVQLDDLRNSFSLKGDIGIRAGEINYLNRRFLLKSGSIAFNENEDKFDPIIDVTGEYRMRTAEGPLILYLDAQGALSNFSPQFRSDPFRTPDELAAIIGESIILPTEYQNFDMESLLSLTTDIGTTVLLRPFEERIRDALGLDLFAFRTDIFKKALLSQGNPISFQDYLDNTSIFLGKYVGDELFVEGLLSFRTEDVYSLGQGLEQQITTELELGLELQTPLFLLNWRFNPENSANLFLNDSEISISWKFSF